MSVTVLPAFHQQQVTVQRSAGIPAAASCDPWKSIKFLSSLGTLLFACILASGCGAARPNKYYQLTIPGSDADPPSDPHPLTLLLGPLQASHLYREDHIVFSSAGEDMGTYEYQRWAEPPTEMIEEVLFRMLRASGRYREIYPLRSNTHGDFLLRGHLYDFKELTGSSLSARVALELELRDIKTGNTVWSHFYSHDEPVGGKDVSAVVAALNRNVHRAVLEFQSSLDQYFSTHQQNPATQ